MRDGDARKWRIPEILLGCLSAAALAACSPPAATGSIEGRNCTTWGAQACSLEPGNPRAECWGANWQIAEYCGDRGCNVVQNGGQTVAYCGDTPPPINDAVSAWDLGGATKTDTSDASAPPDVGADSSASQTYCWGWNCPLGQACSGVGGCEAPGCLPPCSAGQRCSGTTASCEDLCQGACFDSQWCSAAGGGVCTAMPCKTPAFANLYVAASLTLLEGAAAAQHCSKLSGSGGGVLGLSKVLGDLTEPSAAAASGGQQTYALAELGGGAWGWLSARRSGATPCTASECPITASKWENLQPDGNGASTCAPRNRTDASASGTASGTAWQLSLRNSLYRFGLTLSSVQLEVNAARTQAWLCGAVTPAALQAALSSSHSSTGLAIPSTAELVKLAAFDIDSDGNGSDDAWSVAVELSLQPGQLKGWLP